MQSAGEDMMGKGVEWTEQEKEDLREMYPDNDTEDVAIVLGRSVAAVQKLVSRLKIRKSTAWMEQQLERFTEGGKKNRYRKGHVPANACSVGLTGQHPNSRKIQFKKGNLPKNTLRDGAITVREDNRGVPQKMIRVRLGKWVYLSRYNYEQFVGPIPKGHVVRFLDGDTMNCDPSNLECVSKRLNMLINSRHGYSRVQAEVKELCLLINEHINNRSSDG